MNQLPKLDTKINTFFPFLLQVYESFDPVIYDSFEKCE